jgi:hypothetical protein
MGIRHFWVKYFIYPKESFLMNRGYYKAKDGDNPVIQAKDVRKRYKVTLRTAMNVVKQHNAAKEAKKGRLQKMFSNIDKNKRI